MFTCHISQSVEQSTVVLFNPLKKSRVAMDEEFGFTIGRVSLLGDSILFIQQGEDGTQKLVAVDVSHTDAGLIDNFDIGEREEMSVEMPVLDQPPVTPSSFDGGCMAWRLWHASSPGMWLLSGISAQKNVVSKPLQRVQVGVIKVPQPLERIEVSGDHIWAVEEEALCIFERNAEGFISHRVHGVALGSFEVMDVEVGVVCVGGYRTSDSRPVSCMDVRWFTPCC